MTKERFKFNLQLLNDPPVDPPVDPPANPPNDPPADPPANPPADKTFTQSDVSALVAKETKKALEKVYSSLGIDAENAKDGAAKFKDWNESQKTDLQKLQDGKTASDKTIADQLLLIKGFENEKLVVSKGVTAKNADKVLKLAELSSEEDLGKAIDSVLEEFPMFKGEEKPGQFGAGSKGSGGGADEKAKASIRAAMGLK